MVDSHIIRSDVVRLRRRSGMSLLELTVAAALLAVVVATSMKMIQLMSVERRGSEQRAVALQAVQAISERAANMKWDQLTSEAANKIPLPESISRFLPGAAFAVAVTDETEPAAKRLVVELTWNGRGQKRAGPVRLTSWAFPDSVNSTP